VTAFPLPAILTPDEVRTARLIKIDVEGAIAALALAKNREVQFGAALAPGDVRGVFAGANTSKRFGTELS
jgi:hypothetical protein